VRLIEGLHNHGVRQALGAALLFGAGTPLAKQLLETLNPWLLAGLLYLGSGIGLTIYRAISGGDRPHMSLGEWAWLGAAILFGGVIAPVLLMFGLTRAAASSTSLLLNAEGVFTALLAWFVFRENFDRRIALGMASIATGAIILSWPTQVQAVDLWPAFCVLGACFAWALDNNFTRKVSLSDATSIAATKGLCAGTVNLLLAFGFGAGLPSLLTLSAAMLIGLLAYGVSLVLFVLALRNLGTARTGAYFSIAPFIGALIALMLGEPATLRLLLAGIFMGIGVWLHVTERHEHEHSHESQEHEHEHVHDEHHQHEHELLTDPTAPHTHRHRHSPLRHSHVHFPDAHHRHDHHDNDSTSK
jgi:drug/metabolite transporter (DMT)-like permease